MDIETIDVGGSVGVTDKEDPIVAEEGDGALTTSESLKDRPNSSFEVRWGDGRTTWHTSDVTSPPQDHSNESALSVLETESRKQEVRRIFGEDSQIKRMNDGVDADDEGHRHAADVRLRVSAFCEQLEFHAYQNQVKRVYNQLPSEPFQPIGGHESAGCPYRETFPNRRMVRCHPSKQGEYGWVVEYANVKHNPRRCRECTQCRCGGYHFDEPPKNGVETKILAAMFILDGERIESADDPQTAFKNRLQEREGYNDLVTRHALKPRQIRQTAYKHYDTDSS
jgi:hypothetical protein